MARPQNLSEEEPDDLQFNLQGYCRKPCKNCPFRKDLGEDAKGWLGEKMQDIIDDCIDGDAYFICHETSILEKQKGCAGAIILDNKNNGSLGYSNSSTRMAIAFGFIDPKKIKGQDTVFDSIDDCIKFHSND